MDRKIQRVPAHNAGVSTVTFTREAVATEAAHEGTSQEIRPGDTIEISTGYIYDAKTDIKTNPFRRYVRLAKGPGWPLEDPHKENKDDLLPW